MGSAAHSTSTPASTPVIPSPFTQPHAASGSAASFTASHHECAATLAWPRSMRSAAPTASSPAGSADWPSRWSVWSRNPGMPTPERFHAKPASVETTSGLRASSSQRLERDCAASMPTAPKFASGMSVPKRRAAVATPGEPKTLPATARPM